MLRELYYKHIFEAVEKQSTSTSVWTAPCNITTRTHTSSVLFLLPSLSSLLSSPHHSCSLSLSSWILIQAAQPQYDSKHTSWVSPFHSSSKVLLPAVLAECSDRICFRKKKKRKRKEPCLLEAERVRMYSLDSVCACAWVYSRLRISTDIQDMTSNHDELVLYRCTKLFNLTVRGEKEGVWGINRCLCVLWRVQAQQEKMEQGRGGRVGWGYRCTALSNDNGENQRKEMPCTISQDIDSFSPGTPGNCMQLLITTFSFCCQWHFSMSLFDTTTNCIDFKGVYGNISGRGEISNRSLPFHRHTDLVTD